MTGSVLYCGDTTLDSAAAYLASMMNLWGLEFDYVPGDCPLTADMIDTDRSLYIFSDYPAEQISSEFQQQVLKQVESGVGLLMIGGWESFHGLGGDWNGTPISDALPVVISDSDDRQNCDGPVFVQPVDREHSIVADLPWNERPPLIGGFNRFDVKPTGNLILEAIRTKARLIDSGFEIVEVERTPLLVTGTFGEGPTAALATDVAPHWIGPMVDWGNERVAAQVTGTDGIEVGNLYEQFFRQLVSSLLK